MIGSILRARYELTGLVADGPIFATYSARDRQTGRDLAVRLVKAPFSRDSDFLERLKETVTRYKQFHSPNIEALQQVDFDDNNAFIVGDLTRGPSLSDRVRKLAPFSTQVSVGTAISLCAALEPLHKSRVAHGDLQPGNVAVLADGDVRLQLSGIWEAYRGSQTAEAMVLPGLAPYLAPEISAGSPPTPASDVYAIGAILFELLSGRLPYYADTPVAMALQHASSPTPSVRAVNPSVPTVLDEIVKKAMAKQPSQRYASASDMAADLRLLQDALRFGRQLSWPLRPTIPAPTAPTGKGSDSRSGSKVKVTPQPQRVAPRMSALREDDDEDHSRRERKERDVPLWMLFFTTFLAAIALALVVFWVAFNLNKPRTVAIPNIAGLSVNEARDALRGAKLELRVASRLANDKVESDHIIDVNPEAGEKIREGGTVNVTVSLGSRMVAVPDLKGLTLDKAKTVLGTLNLDVDDTVLHEPDPNITEGLIISTMPEAKTSVERQSRVRVTLSSGKVGQISSTSRMLQDGCEYSLRVKLADITEPTQVRVEMVDDEGMRVIHNAKHRPGDSFDGSWIGKGIQAKFLFYYNDKLVKTIVKQATGEQEEQ